MTNIYFTVKIIWMIIGLPGTLAYIAYKVWKWFH